jgi:hypothetical protein
MRCFVPLCSLGALLASACSQPGHDPAVSSTAPAAPAVEVAPAADAVEAPAPLDCAALDPELCTATAGCSPIRGLSAEDLAALQRPDPAFSGPPGEVLGCRSAEEACKEVETTASAGPGEPCTLFGSSCVPSGWQPCTMD